MNDATSTINQLPPQETARLLRLATYASTSVALVLIALNSQPGEPRVPSAYWLH